MRRTTRAILTAAALTALASLCAGCGSFRFAASPEDLYQLPQLPVEYTALNNSINALLAQGEEYAAPVSGSNTQSVQMVDLDGDGREEALAFLKSGSEEKPLKIHIFTQDGESYRQAAVIEGSGAAFYSVSYRDLDGDGLLELLVGWKAAADLQALSVYTLGDDGPKELIQTNYVKYAAADLDENRPGLEVTVLHADDQGSGVADLYAWQREGETNVFSKTSSARLSMTMAELNSGRVVSGTLTGGAPALFVSGVSDSSEEITDVLALKEGELANLVLSDITGVTTELFRFQSLYPTDINGDGVTEVPAPTPLPSLGPEPVWVVGWRQYDGDGKSETVCHTYHNNDDGWYLELPASWMETLLVNRTVNGSDEAVVTFSYREDSGALLDFLRIYTLTGSSRELKASRNGRLILGRQPETIYAAELLEANSAWTNGIKEDTLRAAFKRITTEWRASDN